MKAILKNVRITFPQLWEAKAVNSGDKPRFAASFLMEKDDENYKTVMAAITQVAQEKWKDKAPAMLATFKAKDHLCLHDGATKAQYAGYEGMFFVSAGADENSPPQVFDEFKKPIEARSGKCYSGSYVNASIDIWAQDNAYGKKINAKLLIVMHSKDGDRFAGGAQGSIDDFADIEAAAEFDPFK